MIDPFLQLAEELPLRRQRLARGGQQAIEAADQDTDDRSRQLRRFFGWRKEQRDALFAGRYGEAANELAAFLKGMDLNAADALIALVQAGPWQGADPNIRAEVLSLIDDAIAALREGAGLAPIDDRIPWTESPSAFVQIRELLR